MACFNSDVSYPDARNIRVCSTRRRAGFEKFFFGTRYALRVPLQNVIVRTLSALVGSSYTYR